jgi:hypothetical protein
MKDYKIESANQQNQLDKIRKEMDALIKEHRQSSVIKTYLKHVWLKFSL